MSGETESPTFEEATKCPRCKEPGKPVTTKSIGTRGTLHTLMCMTEGCQWFKTTWVVQVRRDGTIPVADTSPRGSSVYVPSQAEIDRIQQVLQAEHDGSIQPGGKEITW